MKRKRKKKYGNGDLLGLYGRGGGDGRSEDIL